MKRLGLFAFGVTTCVLVPTTLHVLSAGPNQIAKLVAADQTSLDVAGAKVDISADRGLVDAGGKVHVTLTATADKRTKVSLAVLVYEQAGMGEARTEAPPNRVGRDEVTLDVRDGKATKTFAFTLPGNRSEGMGGRSEFGHYTVLVMSPKAADLLEHKRRHSVDSGNDPEHFFESYSGGADTDVGKLGEVARLDVATRTDSDSVKILNGDIAQAGDIAVKVRVHNPTKQAFSAVSVELHPHTYELSSHWLGIKEEDVAVDEKEGTTIALAPRETKDLVFHVHTTETGTLGLLATVQCTGDDCYGDAKRSNATHDLNDTVLDAIDVTPADDKQAGSAVAVAEQRQ
jgi:hypothetical protein